MAAPDPKTSQAPIFTRNMADLLIPGVIVECDPISAAHFGAFDEHAISSEAAWRSNITDGDH